MNQIVQFCSIKKNKMQKITIAKGDGIGPEIMDVTLSILKAAGAEIEYDEIEVGEKIYLGGNSSGITNDSWDVIRRNKILLKSPITTPQGGGYKSLNVSTRKFLGLYANVRPCISYYPFVKTKHPKMDLVIIRENEEDLYAGIEHQQTDEVVQCLKLISRPGCEKIIRYAFEYAKTFNRKKVTCFTKDNIMKQTDGLFHKVFNEIASEYPTIQNDHLIVDIGAARLADTPENFDVIVMPNLYGDILSDVAAQIAGSVGLAGSSNIGEECAMFEAIHGSAPDIAGKNIANPSGLINGAVLMLNHIGQSNIAEKIQNALLYTIEQGIHTKDIFKEGVSKKLVGTKEFGEFIIENLDKKPSELAAANYKNSGNLILPKYKRKNPSIKELVGVDIFLNWIGSDPNELAAIVNQVELKCNIQLSMITNRGIKVWPNGFSETFCTDHWRCRFKPTDNSKFSKNKIIEILNQCELLHLDTIKTENLYEFDGKQGYSLGQGQ
jgi:isocitrate dehydrogenase